ncbi:hypothetical protein VKT23_016235 [Stygiomarasmius scandens]|uniref:WD40 repeat-like protein n=1 Tax=Marasmiellus scandens TaxID=2682957 RepID=A0ABR1J020_9AGAR
MFKHFFTPSYKKLTTLSGPRNAIQSVSFSLDGAFVAAVRYRGVTIWDLKTSETVASPHLPYEPKNPKHVYSSSAWLYFEGLDKYVFVVGNMAGEMSTFRTSGSQIVDEDHTHQVMSMHVLESKVTLGNLGRIATSTSDRLIAVWTLTSGLELANIFKVKLLEDFLPRTVKFVHGSQNVFAFAKMGGGYLQLKGDDGDYSCIKKDGPSEMHSVSVDERNNLFAAWTGQRVQLFKLSSLEYYKTFSGEVSLVGNTKQVVFAEDGSILVVGTDHGFAEVFSVESTDCIQHLNYPRKALVQYVASCTLPSSHLLAIAGSTRDQPGDVIVFRKKRSSSATGKTDGNLIVNVPVTWTGIRWIGFLTILFAMGYFMFDRYSRAFIWNIEGSIYPLGLGLQIFVYVPALSRFASKQGVFNIPTVTADNFNQDTEMYSMTVTITEQHFFTATIDADPFTVTEQFFYTDTITESCHIPLMTTKMSPSLILTGELDSSTITAGADE